MPMSEAVISDCQALTIEFITTICTQQDTAEGMMRTVLQKVFETAAGPTDHVPPCM